MVGLLRRPSTNDKLVQAGSSHHPSIVRQGLVALFGPKAPYLLPVELLKRGTTGWYDNFSSVPGTRYLFFETIN